MIEGEVGSWHSHAGTLHTSLPFALHPFETLGFLVRALVVEFLPRVADVFVLGQSLTTDFSEAQK